MTVQDGFDKGHPKSLAGGAEIWNVASSSLTQGVIDSCGEPRPEPFRVCVDGGLDWLWRSSNNREDFGTGILREMEVRNTGAMQEMRARGSHNENNRQIGYLRICQYKYRYLDVVRLQTISLKRAKAGNRVAEASRCLSIPSKTRMKPSLPSRNRCI